MNICLCMYGYVCEFKSVFFIMHKLKFMCAIKTLKPIAVTYCFLSEGIIAQRFSNIRRLYTEMSLWPVADSFRTSP